MPQITSGSNATITLSASSIIDINCPGGWVQLECPVGTKVFEGNPAGQSFGPYAAGSAKLTSVQGDIYYEVDPAPKGGIAFDPSSVDIAGRRFSSIGTRIFGGRMETDFDNTAANTWEVVTALSQEFDAVRVIFANSRNAGGTTAAPTMLASVAAVADTTVASTDAATWVSVNVNSSGTWTLAAATAQMRRAFVVSDWVALSSIPRTDGGSLPLIAIRAWVNGGNPITLLGSSGGTDSFANWATKPDGRIWRMRKKPGNFASTSQTTFTTSSAAANESPIIGVQYAARGKVVTVMTCGDSIYEGRGTYLGEGFVAPAVWALSNKSGIAYEYANLSWAGQPMSTFENSLNDALAAGIIPDVLVFPAGSPNDISTTISANTISVFRQRASRILATCRTNRIDPVLASLMPTNTAVKSYGATDSLREAYAQDIEARSALGVRAIPAASLMRGVADGSGQYQMGSAYTTDGIHPNDAGNAVLAPAAQSQILKLVNLS